MATQGQWSGGWDGNWYGADESDPTQAAARSLLAFWLGGAVAGVTPDAQGGFRGLLAPWFGGASVSPGGDQAGVRSLLAPWVGGASVAPNATTPGVGSLLAFWMGGAHTGLEVDPEPETEAPGDQGGARIKPRLRTRRWRSLGAVPTPWQLVMEDDCNDEEDLFCIGVL